MPGYKEQCGNCPVLKSSTENDLSRKVFLRKHASFSGLNEMAIVGLSRWLTDCAASSSLFKRNPVVNLFNPVDTQIFAPLERTQARKIFNLPLDKKLILFGAIGAASDPRKGFNELAKSLERLPSEYELIVFGASRPLISHRFKQKVRYLGHLHDDVSLRVLYSAANVMLVPSLQENLSNAIMESLACGTPVVAFDVGGNSDLIDHKINGYLALPYDIIELAQGIDWVLQHDAPPHFLQMLGESFRNFRQQGSSTKIY